MVKKVRKILYQDFYNLTAQEKSFNTPMENNRAVNSQFPYDIEIIASDLSVPWDMDMSDTGDIYFTERPGRIRKIEEGSLLPEPLTAFEEPFISREEGGLMGIALDPDFLRNRYLYVMHSYLKDNIIYNRVVRLVGGNQSISVDRILLDNIPGGSIHNGGRIRIGPDEKLYITTGDAGNPDLSQDTASLAGKILRIELDGSIPPDNPIPHSPVYSWGHRNPQGLAWNEDSVLYASEHGRTGHDEINIILPGKNYGWPLVEGEEETDAAVTIKPLVNSEEDTWAPSGMDFVKEGPLRGNLLVAALRGEQLLAVILKENGREAERVESWLGSRYGRLRNVYAAEDGSVYLMTSNRDGRGIPDGTDDKILRLIPHY